MTDVGKDYGYKDGGGVYQVVKRLEARGVKDRKLARQLKTLKEELSNVKS